jgi:hypothetical protein
MESGEQCGQETGGKPTRQNSDSGMLGQWVHALVGFGVMFSGETAAGRINRSGEGLRGAG